MTTEIRGEDIKTEKDAGQSDSNMVPNMPETDSKKSMPDDNDYDDDDDMPNQGRKMRARKKIIRILDEVVDDDIIPEPEEMGRRRRRGSRRRSRSRSRSRRRRSRRRR